MNEPAYAPLARHHDLADRPGHGGNAARRPLLAAGDWLAGTLRGLTWSRFALFALVLLVLSASESPAIRALIGDGGWVDKALGVAKPWVYMILIFTPVLLLVVAVDNRGPQGGRARIVALGVAVVVGQAIGILLWASSVRILYPAGFMTYAFGPTPNSGSMVRYFIGYGLLLFSTSLTGTAFWYFLRRDKEAARALHMEREHREQVEREQAEVRLSVMQAQVEPHFLFNTLASVRRLYETNPASGRSMLQHLVRYLTASLPMLREAHSTLGRELALAVAYLNVHKVRMGSRLVFTVDVPASLESVVVPPMMIATLVENAVIHGLNPLPEGGHIRISARAAAGGLTVQVADNGQGLRGEWGGGVGLTNIRTRLASEFGPAAELDLSEGPVRGVTATLVLPPPAPRKVAA